MRSSRVVAVVVVVVVVVFVVVVVVVVLELCVEFTEVPNFRDQFGDSNNECLC